MTAAVTAAAAPDRWHVTEGSSPRNRRRVAPRATVRSSPPAPRFRLPAHLGGAAARLNWPLLSELLFVHELFYLLFCQLPHTQLFCKYIVYYFYAGLVCSLFRMPCACHVCAHACVRASCTMRSCVHACLSVTQTETSLLVTIALYLFCDGRAIGA